MPTPYTIEETLTNIASDAVQDAGPFYNGSDIYAAANDFTILGSTVQLGVFKAPSPMASNWTPQDQAHEPAYVYAGSHYPQAGGTVIYFAYSDATTHQLALASFTMGGGWATIATGGPVVSANNITFAIQVVRLSNGHFVVVYCTFAAGPPHQNSTNLVEWSSGGGWGAPIVVKVGDSATSAGSACVAIAVDTNDRVHCLRYDVHLTPTPNEVNYFAYHAGAVSSDTLIFSGNITTASFDLMGGPGWYFSGTDTIKFPVFIRGAGAGGWASLSLTPSAAPTPTLDFVASLPLQVFTVGSPRFMTDGTSQFMTLGRVSDNSPFPQQTLYSKWNGTSWGTLAVGWDSSVDPPSFSFTPEVTVVSARLNPGATGIGTVDGTFNNDASVCGAELYVLIPIAAPALLLACPLVSTYTVGVPFTATMVFSGGTPPYTFTLIAGSLPPGLTLDPSTGIISGTPTGAGSFSYTIQITDANGLTATVTCSLSGSAQPPPPPPTCETVPAPGYNPRLAIYPDPNEQVGS